LPGALAFALDRQERSQVLFSIPVGVYGDVDCEMCCGICGGNQQDHFRGSARVRAEASRCRKATGPGGFRVVADQVLPLERVLGCLERGVHAKNLYLRQELYGIGSAEAFEHYEGKGVDSVDNVA
jgi:hypothetical protein